MHDIICCANYFMVKKDIAQTHITACTRNGATARGVATTKASWPTLKEVPCIVTIPCVVHQGHITVQGGRGQLHATLPVRQQNSEQDEWESTQLLYLSPTIPLNFYNS